MRYEKPGREASRSPEDKLLDEISTAIGELVRRNGGAYSETLAIRPNGHIDADIRPQDSRLPFLPRIFLDVGGPGDKLQGPTIEQFYQLISDLQQHSPGLAFEVAETPHRQTIMYTVRERSPVSREELLIPLKPWDRKSAPNLTDAEYAELVHLVDKFPQFEGETDPDYQRWKELQEKANQSPTPN